MSRPTGRGLTDRAEHRQRAGDEKVTWYGVLGVQPGAEPEQIKQHYEAKSDVLRPAHVNGQPSNVVSAVSQAQGLLDHA